MTHTCTCRTCKDEATRAEQLAAVKRVVLANWHRVYPRGTHQWRKQVEADSFRVNVMEPLGLR